VKVYAGTDPLTGREIRFRRTCNFDQPGVEPSEPVIANGWRQGMTGGAKAHWDCVSELGLAVKLVKSGTLKTYPGYPHGMLTTHADVLNPDLLTFIQS
jgi:hypothetical protein